MKGKKQKQPTPPKGFTFSGWATFNWGISHNAVFRTRREAIRSLLADDGESWDDVKDHFKVMKVTCTVI